MGPCPLPCQSVKDPPPPIDASHHTTPALRTPNSTAHKTRCYVNHTSLRRAAVLNGSQGRATVAVAGPGEVRAQVGRGCEDEDVAVAVQSQRGVCVCVWCQSRGLLPGYASVPAQTTKARKTSDSDQRRRAPVRVEDLPVHVPVPVKGRYSFMYSTYRAAWDACSM